jgi:hypothetical protein
VAGVGVFGRYGDRDDRSRLQYFARQCRSVLSAGQGDHTKGTTGVGQSSRNSADGLLCGANRLYSTGRVPIPSCAKTRRGRFTLGACALCCGLVDHNSCHEVNPFAVPVVRLQEERHQRVIDTGIYAVVRHPMYSGFVPMVVGPALWMGSYVAALLAIVPIGILAVRSLFEERFLKRELKGYDAYTEKVRYRLIPFVW